MECQEFVKRFFKSHPSAVALRLSLVEEKTEDIWAESNILWFTDDKGKWALALDIARPGSISKKTIETARLVRQEEKQNDHSRGTKPLVSTASTYCETISISPLPGNMDALFSPLDDLWFSQTIESAPISEAAVSGDQARSIRIIGVGHQLGVNYKKSVWLSVAVEESAPLDVNILFRYLTRYYPLKFNQTPFHYLSKDFGFKYYLGLPELQQHFTGGGHGIYANGQLATHYASNIGDYPKWYKDLWTRISDLDDLLSGKLEHSVLKSRFDSFISLATQEQQAAAVLCGLKCMSSISRLWIPLFHHIMGSLPTGLAGNDMIDYCRRYLASHPGYMIQGLLNLKEAMDSLPIRVNDDNSKITIQVSIPNIGGKKGAEALIEGVKRLKSTPTQEQDQSVFRTQYSTNILSALLDLLHGKRANMQLAEDPYVDDDDNYRLGISCDAKKIT